MKSYRRRSSREVYRNPHLHVEVHEIDHPTGEPGEHVLIVAPRCSAAVLADGGDLLFARQPRFGAQREMIEIVKGGAQNGESALACAQRETREELGIVALHWESMGALYEIPSLMNEAVQLFFAHGIEHVDTAADAIESIELVRLPESEALKAAASGALSDAVTVAALFRYAILRGRLAPRVP